MNCLTTSFAAGRLSLSLFLIITESLFAVFFPPLRKEWEKLPLFQRTTPRKTFFLANFPAHFSSPPTPVYFRLIHQGCFSALTNQSECLYSSFFSSGLSIRPPPDT